MATLQWRGAHHREDKITRLKTEMNARDNSANAARRGNTSAANSGSTTSTADPDNSVAEIGGTAASGNKSNTNDEEDDNISQMEEGTSPAAKEGLDFDNLSKKMSIYDDYDDDGEDEDELDLLAEPTAKQIAESMDTNEYDGLVYDQNSAYDVGACC